MLSDLSTGTSNPVTNPIDLLTEGALSNAASTAIPEVTGGAVPTYDVDLAQDLLAALGSIAPVSSDLPSLLGTDPTHDVTSLLSGVLTDLGLPVAITGGDLSLNLTGIAADLLEVRVEVRLEMSAVVRQHFAVRNAGHDSLGFGVRVTSSWRASWTRRSSRNAAKPWASTTMGGLATPSGRYSHAAHGVPLDMNPTSWRT